MTTFPHAYKATAHGGPLDIIATQSPQLPELDVQGPPEFGGPEGYWSPETLLTASVASCLILTFRAVSRKAGLEWQDLDVSVEGALDKTPTGLRFTGMHIIAELTINDAELVEKANDLLHKAEAHCLITASLNANVELDARIIVHADAATH